MSNFLEIFKHVLPRGKALQITVDKQLRQFFEGLGDSLGMPTKNFFDEIWLDIFPQTTRELDAWEKQHGLATVGLTEQERRDRLEGTWQALGGQSPYYIQNTLRNSGFDVYVHEWWEPPGIQPITVRNPLLYLRTGDAKYIAVCGEDLMECGEAIAESGNTLDNPGYVLVNKVLVSSEDFVLLCGEEGAECGEPGAEAGNYDGFNFNQKEYPISTDPNTFPYYLYIGDEIFGDVADVDANRRDEFEALCLKICPTHVWLGMLVSYS